MRTYVEPYPLTSGAVASDDPKTDGPVTDEFIRSISELAQRAVMIADRLNQIENRAFGDPLDLVQASKPEAVPAGAAGVIRAKLNLLNDVLLECETRLTHIDQFV